MESAAGREAAVRRVAYTAGYSGRKAADLKALALRLGAVVIDIRFSPRSRVAEWNQGRLERLLAPEVAYYHVPSLGNINYADGGDIQISDLSAGIRVLETASPDQPLILLCVCKQASTCHRCVAVAPALRERGWSVEEVTW